MSIRKSVIAAALAGLFAAACSGGPAAAETRTAQVTRGAVTQSVAVSGSVSSAGTVKLNPPTNGKVAQLMVAVGQQVTAGQPLATLDTSDLQSALTTAQNNVDAAQTNYNKALSGVSDAQSSYSQTQQSTASDIATAQAALAKLKANYAAAKGNFSSLYGAVINDLATYVSQISVAQQQVTKVQNDLTFANQISDNKSAQTAMYQASATLGNAQNYVTGVYQAAEAEYISAVNQILNAVAAFDAAVAANADTTAAGQQLSTAQVAYTTASARLTTAIDAPNGQVSSAQSSAVSAQNSLNTLNAKVDTTLDAARADIVPLLVTLTGETQGATNVKSKISQVGTTVTTISDAISGSYATAVQNVAAAQLRAAQSLQSAQTSLNNQPSNVQSALNSLNNAQTALATAQANVDNAVIKATVAGVVTAISAQVGENVSSTSTTGFIVIANTGSMALHGTIGEADIVKLKLGQVATVTVDAIGTAKMTGKVTSLDPVATISGGVPVYGVDVTIDLPNQSVKPGMSGTANVIIASSPNALTVPNLAVKTASGRRYLTVMKDGQPVDTDVTFGLTNDTVTEVLTGVQEGDVVVLPQPRASATNAGGGRGIQFGGGGGGNPVPGR
ncbi:MAG TPA: biotin/lipoyl-binding protein [Candidatus Saccharimonadales bacterium]|jgi:RND family efflux transporter MFP subunit|nr:biotin/lipoyl-binding protein [Candidatus Saccharimonadales bacterium]